MEQSGSDMETLSVLITSATERLEQQVHRIEALSAANQETWKAVQALVGLEATRSELMIHRDVLALAHRLRELRAEQNQ